MDCFAKRINGWERMAGQRMMGQRVMKRDGEAVLVIGLGNPILGDDGVGWRVAEEVKRLLMDDCRWLIDQSAISHQPSTIDVDCLSLGGLSLMERMVGYDRAIVIDAMRTHQPPGTLSRFWLDELPECSTAHTASAHDASLAHALQLGRALGAHLPCDVLVVGVAAEQLYDFSDALTPEVEAAVPHAAQIVIDLLQSTPEEAWTYGLP